MLLALLVASISDISMTLTDTDVKYLLLYFEQNYGLTSEKKMTAVAGGKL